MAKKAKAVTASSEILFANTENVNTFYFGDTFTVLVGRENRVKSFTIHTCIATESSDFFTAALKKEWKGGQDRVVRLPEADPKAFAHYAQWLYRRRIHFADLAELEQSPATDVPERGQCAVNLCRLYVLGEQVCDFHLQDYTIDSLLEYNKKFGVISGVACICIAWEGTCESTALRRLIVDFWASCLPTPKWFADYSSSGAPGEFKDELIVKWSMELHKDMVIAKPSMENKERYYQGHVVEEPEVVG